MGSPTDLEDLSRAELKALVAQLLGEVAELKQTITAQRDEIARLKRLKSRPRLKPSGMEKSSERGTRAARKRRRRKVVTSADLAIDEERVIKVEPLPPGSRFKGYADFLVQDLMLRPHVVRIRRERWVTPDGQTVTASMPPNVTGHFGSELRRFVLVQFHQGQVTVPRLVAQLRAIGIQISKRQILRLLNEGQDAFQTEARDVLRAGLATAAWISVDDTGARHRGRNGTCTQMGNDHFAAFVTTTSKSRLNFLALLRAGHSDYVINAEALAYMRQRGLSGLVIERLATHPEHTFPDEATWTDHLQRLGISDLKVNPDPVRIATEGALWGAIKAHGLLPGTVIVSDDAGQFLVGCHALCWVHAERLVHKLDTFTDQQRRAQQSQRYIRPWASKSNSSTPSTLRWTWASRARTFGRVVGSIAIFSAPCRRVTEPAARRAEQPTARNWPRGIQVSSIGDGVRSHGPPSVLAGSCASGPPQSQRRTLAPRLAGAQALARCPRSLIDGAKQYAFEGIKRTV